MECHGRHKCDQTYGSLNQLLTAALAAHEETKRKLHLSELNYDALERQSASRDKESAIRWRDLRDVLESTQRQLAGCEQRAETAEAKLKELQTENEETKRKLEVTGCELNGRLHTTESQLFSALEKLNAAEAKLKELQEQKPVAWVAGIMYAQRDKILGASVSFVDLNWNGQVPLYAYPIDVEALQQRVVELQAMLKEVVLLLLDSENEQVNADNFVRKCREWVREEKDFTALESMLQQARKEENEAALQSIPSEINSAPHTMDYERDGCFVQGFNACRNAVLEAIRARMK